MRSIFNLFTRKIIVFIALMLVVGIITEFELDSRIGMLLVGVIFGLSGMGHFLIAKEEKPSDGLRKGMGIFLIVFSLFTMVVMVAMFVCGERI